jgi:hypothetical protein
MPSPQQSTAHNNKLQQSTTKKLQQSTTNATKATRRTTIKRLGRFLCLFWFALVSFHRLGSIFCLCCLRHNIQQHTTTTKATLNQQTDITIYKHANYNNTHYNQLGGAFLSVVVQACFVLCEDTRHQLHRRLLGEQAVAQNPEVWSATPLQVIYSSVKDLTYLYCGVADHFMT